MLYPLLLFSVTLLILCLEFLHCLQRPRSFFFQGHTRTFLETSFEDAPCFSGRISFVLLLCLHQLPENLPPRLGLVFPSARCLGEALVAETLPPDKEKEGCSCSSLSPARHLQTLDRSGGFGQGVWKSPLHDTNMKHAKNPLHHEAWAMLNLFRFTFSAPM